MIFNSDHPSRCGENRLYLTSESTRSGSSPRTRGKPCVLRHTHLFNGITPAGAGKTKPLSANAVTGYGSSPQVRGKLGKTAEIRHRRQDHPRRCGENGLNLQTCHHMIGSPPQVRGKQRPGAAADVHTRITPAGAGKTRHGRTDSGCHRDHPRGCGENHKLTVMCSDGKGSPPQVRGKHRHSLPRKAEHKDHPRRCGENISAVRLIASLQGSPPQVRGKLYGDTLWSIARRDHPRRCGENVGFGEVCCRNQGSPPQVRGKRLMCGFCVPELGITPAGAGKTRHKADHDKRPEDHPRRCGENHIQRKLSVCKQGSPPQVRGKRGKHSLHACRVGITPAGAGKT